MKTNFSIVCPGEIINSGLTLKTLFTCSDKENSYFCKTHPDVIPELYAESLYQHGQVPKKYPTVFISRISADNTAKVLLDKFGMKIQYTNDVWFFSCNTKELSNAAYGEFIKYANGYRTRYINQENEYAGHVNSLNDYCIPSEFIQIAKKALLTSKSKTEKAKLKQLFECMALVFFLDILPVMTENKNG